MASDPFSRPSRLLAIAMVLGALVAAGCVSGPSEIECTAKSEGNLVEWSPVENATSYNVFRFEQDEEANFTEDQVIATVNETSYLDTNVTEGVVYRYAVNANFANGTMSLPSDICEVTAIPFFPGLGVLAVAVVGGAVGYAVLRSRRGKA